MTERDEPDYTDLFRTCIDSTGTDPSCEELFRYLRPVFQRIARRIARQWSAPSEVDDVVQEINLKVLNGAPAIVNVLPKAPQESLAYFSVVAANAARDFFRTRKRMKQFVDDTVPVADTLEWLAYPFGTSSMERNLLLARIEQCVKGERKEQVIFRLYYRQGFSAREISGIPGLALTVEGVESAIFRLTRQIRKCMGMAPLEKSPSGKRESQRKYVL